MEKPVFDKRTIKIAKLDSPSLQCRTPNSIEHYNEDFSDSIKGFRVQETAPYSLAQLDQETTKQKIQVKVELNLCNLFEGQESQNVSLPLSDKIKALKDKPIISYGIPYRRRSMTPPLRSASAKTTSITPPPPYKTQVKKNIKSIIENAYPTRSKTPKNYKITSKHVERVEISMPGVKSSKRKRFIRNLGRTYTPDPQLMVRATSAGKWNQHSNTGLSPKWSGIRGRKIIESCTPGIAFKVSAGYDLQHLRHRKIGISASVLKRMQTKE